MTDIWDMINKKANKIKSIKDRTSRDFDYSQEAKQFFRNMDKHYAEATDANDLKHRFKKEYRLLYSRLRHITPGISCNAIWNTQEDDVDWKSVRVQSVVISFPDGKQEAFDVGDLLMDEIFGI